VNTITVRFVRQAACALACLAINLMANAGELKSLTVCADPGNMPLSNQKGEGFENKIAQVIGAALGTGVQYYWRPSIERGLMRTTLSAGNCDLWLDMASDTEGAQVLTPLYRSTFVLAYRNDRGVKIKDLDDPALKKLRVGVFQVSAIRQALAEHGVMSNTVIHYLSHNADLVADNQPSYQVRQVIDGGLDVAAAWGPMAGYYATVLHAPLTIEPVNMFEDDVPMEFDMSLAVPKGRPDIQTEIEHAMKEHSSEIHKILADFGVPLVKCDECIVSGDLPSHGPYHARPIKQDTEGAARLRVARMSALKKELAQGANPDDELNNAVVGNDTDRVAYLLQHRAHVNAADGEGNAPLVNAARFGFMQVCTYLAEHGANVNLADRSGWTALMYAAWRDDPEMIRMLIGHGANRDATDKDGLTPLAIAAQNGKTQAVAPLLEAGADVNAPVAKGGYTPLMLAAISGSGELATTLITHGAKVNAVNPGGVTALMIAAATNHSNIATLLLASGADVNAHSEDGRTALSIAKANNTESVVRLLEDAQRRASVKPN
jgi:quinoprotein dehydrogenase-associated probable ABC transporter substrate-binding protein